MRAVTALAEMRLLPIQNYQDAFGTQTVLILAPHPDDESLGCGGLIAEACARGVPPVVTILTDGSRSHPNSLSFPPQRLRSLRRAEVGVALSCLGAPRERLAFLDYRDGAAPAEGAPMAEAAERLARLITAQECQTVLVSWRHDPHCDHLAAACIAEAACRLTGARLLAYPVWGWTLPPETVLDCAPITGFRLDVAAHIAAKRAAIESHRSQYAGIITDDPGGFQMAPGFIEMFLAPTETYIDVELSP